MYSGFNLTLNDFLMNYLIKLFDFLKILFNSGLVFNLRDLEFRTFFE